MTAETTQGGRQSAALVDLQGPPFGDHGIAGLLLKAANAYASEYEYGGDEGADYVPTEREQILLVDMVNGLFSEDAFWKPLQWLIGVAALKAAPLPPAAVSDDQIKHMVNRFLGWRLPENFAPDAGISFKPTFNDHLPIPTKHTPSGTNLFDATQADAMVRYMVEGLPQPDDAVGCAEREVGRYVYSLIEARMDAKAGTPEGAELSYLAGLVSDVEEYGADKLSVGELSHHAVTFPSHNAALSEAKDNSSVASQALPVSPSADARERVCEPSTAKVFSFDAETNGLWGQAFAIAAVVYDGPHIQTEFFGRLADDAVTEPWVRENVLPALAGAPVTHTSYDDLLRDFAAFYLANKADADVIVHMGVPVEARLLIDMRERGFIGDWDGPYPLHDVAGLLKARGEDPTSVDAYIAKHCLIGLDGGISPHHPRYDSIAAAVAYLHLEGSQHLSSDGEGRHAGPEGDEVRPTEHTSNGEVVLKSSTGGGEP